jgi:serine/threonine protein kinase
MGSVWLAEHVVLGKRFAIKLLHSEIANDVELRARFEQEARTIGRLDHPNIVSATNFGLTPNGQPYLVMEALRGQSVRALIEQIRFATGGPMPSTRAITLIRQACAGIAHAHENGIVHRDLKPENLFVTQSLTGADCVKVLDFGIAKIRDDTSLISHKTRTGVVLGTPYYMSSEQARGESDIDFRTDIYSLSAILYELVSGHKAHDGEQYNALLADIIMHDAPPLDELALALPLGLSQVLQRGMARERENRYQTVREFEQALGALVDAPSLGRALTSEPGHNSAKFTNTVVLPNSAEVSSLSAQSVPKTIAEQNVGRFPLTNTVRRRNKRYAVATGVALLAVAILTYRQFRHPDVARSPEPSNGQRATNAHTTDSNVNTTPVHATDTNENAPVVRPIASSVVTSEETVPGNISITPIASASVAPVSGVNPAVNSPADESRRSIATVQKSTVSNPVTPAPARKTVRNSEPPVTPTARPSASVKIRVPQNPY